MFAAAMLALAVSSPAAGQADVAPPSAGTGGGSAQRPLAQVFRSGFSAREIAGMSLDVWILHCKKVAHHGGPPVVRGAIGSYADAVKENNHADMRRLPAAQRRAIEALDGLFRQLDGLSMTGMASHQFAAHAVGAYLERMQFLRSLILASGHSPRGAARRRMRQRVVQLQAAADAGHRSSPEQARIVARIFAQLPSLELLQRQLTLQRL
jgi:hypothetical protein